MRRALLLLLAPLLVNACVAAEPPPRVPAVEPSDARPSVKKQDARVVEPTPVPDANEPVVTPPVVNTPDARPSGAPDLGASSPEVSPAPDASFPPSATGCGGAAICDDFERHPAGGQPGGEWKNLVSGGQLAIDTTRAFSGKQSLKTSVTAGGYRRAFISRSGAPLFPIKDNVLWVRMMIYMDQVPPDGVHWTHIEGSGPVQGRAFRAQMRWGGMFKKTFNLNYKLVNVGSECWKNSKVQQPEGRWVCYEYRINGPKNEVNLYMDGQPVPDMQVVQRGSGCNGSQPTGGVWELPQLDTVHVGLEKYQDSAVPSVAWIDDVAIGGERVGCPTR